MSRPPADASPGTHAADVAHRAELPMHLEPLRDHLRRVIAEKGLLTDGPYQLSAGGTSPYLFDLKPVLLDPVGAHLLGTLGAHVAHGWEGTHVGGRELGAVPIAASIAQASHAHPPELRGFFARKQPKGHGARRLLEGNVPGEGHRAVVVEDVTTTGASSLKVVEEVRASGAEVRGALTLVDREEGAAGRFSEADVPFQALLLLRDFPEIAALRR